MRYVLAVLLLAHGFAHMVGFVVPWRLVTLEEMPYKTTLLGGRLDVGHAGARAVGILWLLLGGVVFTLGGTLALTGVLSGTILLASVVLSSVLCVLGWPDSKLGLVANAVILALYGLSLQRGWL
jgi:hypothetical protein